MTNKITVETTVGATIDKVWEYWNAPEHIVQWAFASDDWHAPRAQNDVRTGGNFLTRMESRDGKEGFDFAGTYTDVEEYKRIVYVMTDPVESHGNLEESGRRVEVEFQEVSGGVKIVETFDPENENPIEVQRAGWQSILDNFKKYVETSS